MLSRTRRMLLATTGAAFGLAALPRAAGAARGHWPRYDDATVIEGLGGPGGIETEDGAPLTPAQVEDVRTSGIACFHLTVGEVGAMPADEAHAKIVASIARWEREIDAHPARLARVRTVSDIQSARSGGRAGLVYGLQDGVAFETDLERLATLHGLGLRVVQPTYNRRNLLGDGCMEPVDAGLSALGHAAVERMQSLGILLDLSHCGRLTAGQALAASKRPAAFTHTGCTALADHPRNRTDGELRAVAATGGVAGIYVMPYLNDGRQPTAEVVVRHIEHAVNVAGEDHVAIGTDGTLSAVDVSPEFRRRFAENVARRKAAGIAATQEFADGYLFADDLNTPRRFELLAELLSARGHGDARIEKILGGNLLRVFDAAWSA